MPERKLGKRCRFASECPVYKGEIRVDSMPKYLYRNVFCERGERGWKNCEHYVKYSESESSNS